MNDEDYQVSSEIYDEYDYISTSRPIFCENNIVSRFSFCYPQYKVTIDSDGDLEVPRKQSKATKEDVVEIEHKRSTVLDLVGLQIWRGSLLLADWLIHNSRSIPRDSYILELGSGVGLTSIVASMFSPVYCTDIDKGDLLKLIGSNVRRNKHITKYPVKVLELDFTVEELPKEIISILPKVGIVIAADTVYDDDLTDAFVRTIQRILSKLPKCTVYVALEKRFVFTLADCDSVAPCYDYFLRCLQEVKGIGMEEVPLDFSKYFKYERVNELVLWKITSVL